MGKDICIAIMSDLHCAYGSGKSVNELNTFLTSDMLPSKRHPIEALKRLIEQEKIQADLLLCPGDITDRIGIQGLLSGWGFLQRIQKLIGDNILLAATVGNHDVDSRNIHKKTGPFEAIKSLGVFDFPTNRKDANDSFWSRNYYIIEGEQYQLLVVNSSYSHTNPENASKCEIDNALLDDITDELNSMGSTGKFRICMLHHHPLHHSNIDYKDGDFVDKGDKLLALLDSHGFSIVVHGHKHDPRLTRWNDLHVFASGSFSSTMNIVELKADNTFHLLTLKANSKKGIIKTWVFGPAFGWTQKTGTYFPSITGFGNRVALDVLAKSCAAFLPSEGIASFNDLLAKVPDLEYLTPSEQEKIQGELETHHGVTFSPKMPDRPLHIIKLQK